MNPWNCSQEEVLAAYADGVQVTYGRIPLVFVRGEGARLWDVNGKEYLDWVSGGRAGTALGHCHPHVVAALEQQLKTLTFVSNDYYHPWAGKLGQMLAARSGGRKSFFCNSGAEASEGALKLARKWGHQRRGDECFEIITFTGSFHGRTYGAISATAQPKYQEAFRPIVPGFKYVPWGDVDALDDAVGPQTAAIFVEPVQGESGIHPASRAFMQTIDCLADERDVLFIADEVQTGFGRTGKFWAYEHYDVNPHVVTLAKALGGGVTLAAVLAKPDYCALTPGDHGCTFGGNPFATAAGIAALEALDAGDLVANAATQGEYILAQFREWQGRLPGIKEVRGLGLMLAIEFEGEEATEIQRRCQEAGLLIHTVGPTILRILPPLILTRADVDAGLKVLHAAISG